MTTESETKPPSSNNSRKVLIALLIGTCALYALDFQAKRSWGKALNSANKLMDEGENNPATYMEKVGKSPRVKVENNKLTQVYRWTGSLKSYDLLVSFRGKDGSRGVDDVIGKGTRVFGAENVSKMQLAKATGTLDENLVIPDEDITIIEDTNPMATPGESGDTPRGGSGDRPGGGGGQNFQGFKDTDLKMDTETQAKWDAAVKQMEEAIGVLPEDRRERFTKMRELQQKFREESKGYLTEEQYANFEENNPARRSRERSGISAEQLGLEGDAKEKYEAATGKMREQMRALFSEGGGGSREELQGKMTAMSEAHEAELKIILNEVQFKKYQELQNQQRQRGGRSREPDNESPPLNPPKEN
jgi:hypothetical protein